MNLTSYLIFNGQAEKAANFYAEVLGGKVEDLYRYDSVPPTPEMPIPEECKQMVLHCSITFPGGLMCVADTFPHDKRDFGNKGCMLTVNCDSIAHAEKIYAKLTEGAQEIVCELGEVFYAKRYGEVVDKFGVFWAIMYDEN